MDVKNCVKRKNSAAALQWQPSRHNLSLQTANWALLHKHQFYQ